MFSVIIGIQNKIKSKLDSVNSINDLLDENSDENLGSENNDENFDENKVKNIPKI